MQYYNKSSQSSTKGEMYEVKLPALLFLRCKRNRRISRFQLATNVAGPDALDDVVLRYQVVEQPGKWYTCFLQLKNKEQRTLNRNSITTGNKYPDKYPKSFSAIKELMKKEDKGELGLFNGSFENCQFCVYTSSKVAKNLSNCKEEGSLGELCSLLDSHSEHATLIGFKKGRDDVIFNKFEEKDHEFLEHLKIFADQPTDEDLINIIKEELRICPGVSAKDVDGIYTHYEQLFYNWWNKKKVAEIIDESSDLDKQAIYKVLIENVKRMCDTEQKTHCFAISFKEMGCFENVLNTSVPLLHVTTPAAALKLSCTKLVQSLKPVSCIFVGIECLLREHESVLKVWESGELHWLVIQSNGLQDFEELSDRLFQLLESNANKRIAIVSPHIPSDILFVNLETKLGSSKCREVFDKCNFSELCDTICDELMEMNLLFQGKEVSLKTLIRMDQNIFCNIILDDELVKGFFSKRYSLGNSVSKDVGYFIPRTIKSFHISHTSVFNADLESVVAVSGVTPEELKNLLPPGKRFCVINDQVSESCKYILLDSEGCVNQWRDLCRVVKKAHWIQRQQDNFVLCDSRGPISDIRPHLVQAHCMINSAVDVPQRCSILSGESGMGKSTFITYLAKQTKQVDPSLWVICVPLNRDMHLLEQYHDATGFLASVLGVEESPFKMSLLRHGIEVAGNVVVFLDGFDEIIGFSDYDDKCLTLCADLMDSKIQKVWLSSRTSVVERLESKLSTVATELHELSTSDQIEFLRMLLRNTNADSKSAVIENILSKFSVSSQNKSFTANPLHMKMIGEVLNNSVNSEWVEVPNNINLAILMKTVIEQKFDIYFRNLFPDAKHLHRGFKNDQKLIFEKKHMFVSLKYFQCYGLIDKLCHGNEIIRTSNTFLDEILKCAENGDIVDQVVDGRPHFIHQCFAEYFAALYFFIYNEENREYLTELLFNDWYPTLGICHMFNLIAAGENGLHNAVLSNDKALVKQLLQKGEVDVMSRDSVGRTALHLAACSRFEINDSGTFEAILPEPWYQKPRLNLDTQNRQETMVDILVEYVLDCDISDTMFGWSPCQYAIQAKNWNAVEILLSKTENSDNLTFPLDVTDYSLWGSIIDHGHSALMKLIISRGLYNGDDASNWFVLQRSILKGHVKLVKVLVRSKEDIFLPDRNILHHSSMCGNIEILKFLFSVLDEEIGKEGRIEAMNRRDHGYTATSTAALYGHHSTIEFLLENGGSKTLLDEDFKRILEVTAINGSSDVFKMIFDNVKEENLLTVDDYQQLLYSAASWGHTSIAEVLIGGISPKGNEFVKQCIDFKGKQGLSTLTAACMSDKSDILELLIKSGGSVSLDCEYPVLHCAIHNSNIFHVKLIIESLGNNPELIKQLINNRSSSGMTAMHCPSMFNLRAGDSQLSFSNQAEIMQYLISNDGDIRVLDNSGFTPLHYAVYYYGILPVGKVLIKRLGENKKEILEYINTINADGKTARDYTRESSCMFDRRPNSSLFGTDLTEFGKWLDEIAAMCN